MKTLLKFLSALLFIVLLSGAIGFCVCFYWYGSNQRYVRGSELTNLLAAIAIVESNDNPQAVGDNGRAYGLYQLWNIYVQDVNRIYDTTYTHKDAFNPDMAERMVRLYWQHYATNKRLGHNPTFEDMARIHNGGPNGWKKELTKSYWEKIKEHLIYD